MLAAPRMNSPLNRKIEAATAVVQRRKSGRQTLVEAWERYCLRTRGAVISAGISDAKAAYDVTAPPSGFAAILQATRRHFGLSETLFESRRRSPSIVRPRQIAMYLAYKHTRLSLPQIGARMGFDHTTVLNNRDRIAKLISIDPSIRADVEAIEAALSGESR